MAAQHRSVTQRKTRALVLYSSGAAGRKRLDCCFRLRLLETWKIASAVRACMHTTHSLWWFYLAGLVFQQSELHFSKNCANTAGHSFFFWFTESANKWKPQLKGQISKKKFLCLLSFSVAFKSFLSPSVVFYKITLISMCEVHLQSGFTWSEATAYRRQHRTHAKLS